MYKVEHNDAGRSEAGFANEYNDCTVRTYALAGGIGYKAAHDLFEKFGRKGHKSYNFRNFMKTVRPDIEHNYFERQHRVKTMLRDNYYKNVVMRIRGHVFCVKDNVILDLLTNTENCLVTDIWYFK